MSRKHAVLCAARTKIDFGGAVQGSPTAKAITLQGLPGDVNTQFAQPIRPRTSQVRVSNTCTHTFPPNSTTFLRVKDRGRS